VVKPPSPAVKKNASGPACRRGRGAKKGKEESTLGSLATKRGREDPVPSDGEENLTDEKPTRELLTHL